MKQIGMAAAMVFSIALLLGALGLSFMASWGRIDPDLHAMAAFVAGLFALGMHARSGSGLDFLAVLLLVAALAFGLMVLGGGMSLQFHLWAAVPAVVVSVYTQIYFLLTDIINM